MITLAIALGAWALMAVAIAHRSLIVLAADNSAVVERLGRYEMSLRAGLHFVVPFFDRTTRISNTRRVELARQPYFFRDIVRIELEPALAFEVFDVLRAVYGIADVDQAISGLAIARTSNAIGRVSSTASPFELLAIGEQVKDELNELALPWGLKVTAYSLGRVERELESHESTAPSVGGSTTPVAISSD